MKFSKLAILLVVFFIELNSFTQIRLIIRANDMGMSRSTDTAIIDDYLNGIVTTTEVMVPCPWFNNAAELLNNNPGLDVGIHLVLNSEWTNYKWRPLTSGASIRDADGYFYPAVWGSAPSLQYATVSTAEVETELRAQITLCKKKIPHLSHITEHMYFGSLNTIGYRAIVNKLATEFGLYSEFSLAGDGVTNILDFSNSGTYAQRKASFISKINSLTAGTYHLLEHPSVNSLETRGMKGPVAVDRDAVFNLFKDPAVMQAITNKGIQLISYKTIKDSKSAISNESLKSASEASVFKHKLTQNGNALEISSINPVQNDVFVSIYSVNGQLVLKQLLFKSDFEATAIVDVASLESAIYIVNITSAAVYESSKLSLLR